MIDFLYLFKLHRARNGRSGPSEEVFLAKDISDTLQVSLRGFLFHSFSSLNYLIVIRID